MVEIERKKITIPEYDDTDEFMYRGSLLELIKRLANRYKNSEIIPILKKEYEKQIG